MPCSPDLPSTVERRARVDPSPSLLYVVGNSAPRRVTVISDHRHQVIDADGHVIERDQELFEFLPPPFRGYGRVLAYPFFPTLDGFHRAARKAADGTRVTSRSRRPS